MPKPLFTILNLTCLLLLLSGEASAQFHRGDHVRISPLLYSDSAALSGSYHILVEDEVAFSTWAAKNLPGVELREHPVLEKVYRISDVTSDDVKKLLAVSGMRFLENADRKPKPENSVPGLDLSLNTVATVHHTFPALTGKGLKVSIKENPFNENDIDLAGRVYNPEDIPAGYDPHATTMATIISGAGNSSPQGKGVAWQAHPGFSDFMNLFPESTPSLLSAGIVVQNHSYGVGVENFYGIEAHAYDRQCADYPLIMHVFSVGNSGAEPANSAPFQGIQGYANITGEFKTAKNTLAVGGVNREGIVAPRSSRGPTADGRIKPELVAYGNGGTSEAAAIVSGISLLIQDRYRQLTDTLPHSSLVKAALINSADDAGSPEVDFIYGFGIADALGAVETINDRRFFSGVLSQDETRTFVITAPIDSRMLKVTLVWIDPQADPGSDDLLVNDLDLQLYDPNGVLHQPWVLNAYPHPDSLQKSAQRGEDRKNNVEQVTIPRPAEGQYTIQVRGSDFRGGPQAFYIAYEISSHFRWIYPTASDAQEAGSEGYLRWKWDGEDVPAIIQWSIAGSDSWTTLGEVSMSQGYFRWKMPDINGIVSVRLIQGNAGYAPGSFVVSHQPQMKLGYNCEHDAMLFWSNHGSLNSFRLQQLSGGFLDAGILVGDTTFHIDKREGSAGYYSVTPLIEGRSGVRSVTIPFDDQFGDCYVRSFVARELVSDTVILDVVLSTGYGLKSMTLERQSAAGFTAIETSSPVRQTVYGLVDTQPQQGKNRYRLRFERTNGEIFYSQTEEVWYASPGDLILFPNPVRVGDILSIVIESDPAFFRLYDPAGILVGQGQGDGEVKTIDTTGLNPGIFFLKVFTGSGEVLTGKIIVK